MNKVLNMKPAEDFFHPNHAAWQDYDGGLPEEIVQALPRLNFGTGLTIRSQKLSFYPKANLLILRNSDWSQANLFIYALKSDDELVWLNGTSPGIHKFNAAGNLALSASNALDYLHFFCFFVRGDEGPFYIATTPDALYLPAEISRGAKANDGKLRMLFEQRFQSPRYFGQNPKGEYRFSALVCYSNAVFVADFEVQPGGMISMMEDTPIMTDLPTKIDAPLVPIDNQNRTVH